MPFRFILFESKSEEHIFVADVAHDEFETAVVGFTDVSQPSAAEVADLLRAP